MRVVGTFNPTSCRISPPWEIARMNLSVVTNKVQPHIKHFNAPSFFLGIGSGVCLKFDNMELNLITLYASNK